MCLDCGCHAYSQCHGDIRHITTFNVNGAIDANHGHLSAKQVVKNVKRGLDEVLSGDDPQIDSKTLGNDLCLKIGFDIDDTITSAPTVLAAIAHALRQCGHKVYIITGHGPVATREQLLDTLHFEYDVLEIVDPGDDGSGKAAYIAENHIDFMFDNNTKFGAAISAYCPVTFMYDKPPAEQIQVPDPLMVSDRAAKTLALCKASD